jgi:hypothetical protein
MAEQSPGIRVRHRPQLVSVRPPEASRVPLLGERCARPAGAYTTSRTRPPAAVFASSARVGSANPQSPIPGAPAGSVPLPGSPPTSQAGLRNCPRRAAPPETRAAAARPSRIAAGSRRPARRVGLGSALGVGSAWTAGTVKYWGRGSCLPRPHTGRTLGSCSAARERSRSWSALAPLLLWRCDAPS